MDLLRVPHAFVNWYLLADDDGVTVVDAGLPRHWNLLPRAPHPGLRAARGGHLPAPAARPVRAPAVRLRGQPRLPQDRRALRRLDRIGETGATHLLPGHGDPWHGPAQEAVAIARRNGTR